MHFICHRDDIEEGTAKGFVVADIAIFAVKKEGKLYFYRNQCPHLDAEMELMDDEFLNDTGDLIRCQYHGALFEIDNGQCISGPCTGDVLQAVDTVLHDHRIYML